MGDRFIRRGRPEPVNRLPATSPPPFAGSIQEAAKNIVVCSCLQRVTAMGIVFL